MTRTTVPHKSHVTALHCKQLCLSCEMNLFISTPVNQPCLLLTPCCLSESPSGGVNPVTPPPTVTIATIFTTTTCHPPPPPLPPPPPPSTPPSPPRQVPADSFLPVPHDGSAAQRPENLERPGWRRGWQQVALALRLHGNKRRFSGI